MKKFSDHVLAWYDKHGRKNLPWQKVAHPYNIWVSEIMLQQTRVDAVIPYYEKFIQRFPTLEVLAKANVDEVLHHWTGLGYYARARNLHKSAQLIVEQHNASFPQNIDEVVALPGIGRSTAAAILSLSFNQPHAILDGNVKRVLARVFAIEGWSGNKEMEQKLWQHAEALLPKKNYAAYTQAMMDLGATLCTRSQPDCQKCPVQKHCMAYAQKRQAELPTPKPSKKLPQREIVLAIVQSETDQSIWLEKRPPTGIWGGLYSFPEFKDEAQLARWSKRHFKCTGACQSLSSVQHTFSHFHLTLHPRLMRIDKKPNGVMEDAHGVWYKKADQKIGLAAPVKKVLAQVMQQQKENTHDAHGAMCEA